MRAHPRPLPQAGGEKRPRRPYPPVNHSPPCLGKLSPPSTRNALKGFAMFKRLSDDEAGATAIEYGLIAALIALAAIIAFQALGLNLADVFDTISTALRTNL